MKKRFILVLLALLLLAGCAPDTPPATVPTVQEAYPTPLENDFYVCTDKIDMVYHRNFSMASSAVFYLMTKDPITAEDVAVKTGDIPWAVTLSRLSKAAELNPYRPEFPYMICRDVNWNDVYQAETEELDATYRLIDQYAEEAGPDLDYWFPGYSGYMVKIEYTNRDLPEPEVENGHTETDLTVTVKGNTQVLKDVCNIRFYDDLSQLPDHEGPLTITQMSTGNGNFWPTEEGYFYSDKYTVLTAREDATITGAYFYLSPSASFVELQLIVNGLKIDWDGKTPVDVMAGETVQLHYVAKDPELGGKIVTRCNRIAMLEYTSEGENYVQGIDCVYTPTFNFYECYTFANGNAENLYKFYADYRTKASGWCWGYVTLEDFGSGKTGNPFLDY